MAPLIRSVPYSALRPLLMRDHTLLGGILFGIDGHLVELQARATDLLDEPCEWRSAVKVIGMPRGALSEAWDRISAAFSKLRIPHPQVGITVNLLPPDLPKEGTSLDLPLAILALQAAGMLPDLPAQTENKFVLIGEVGIHGDLRRVPGVLSIAFLAQPNQTIIVPAGNEKEAALIIARPGHDGCVVGAVQTLQQAIEFFQGKGTLDNALRQEIKFESITPPCTDFAQIKGQQKAKDASLIAAAGGHNLLLIGPPGEGKSLLANALVGILPPLSNEEKVELTRIYSASGELAKDGQAVTRRPFRKIHHNASRSGLLGGGSGLPKPGEITKAHLGVLFLDEIAEFSASTLDALRQPIEDGNISISRVDGSLTFPSRFTLVAAMNPCPCGYFGSEQCKCDKKAVTKYQKKLSGPILDRIDLQVELKRLTTEERFSDDSGMTTKEILRKITAARTIQHKRFEGTKISYNAAIPGGAVREYCMFSQDGFQRFAHVVDTSTMSTRSMDRLAKVSRTVADLKQSGHVEPEHIDVASTYVIGGLLRESW